MLSVLLMAVIPERGKQRKNQNELILTAANVTVSGKVTTSAGRGIRNVGITLTDQNGVMSWARTNPFGYFSFNDVAAGETYIFSVNSKRYIFSQPTQVLTVNEDFADLNFTANP